MVLEWVLELSSSLSFGLAQVALKLCFLWVWEVKKSSFWVLFKNAWVNLFVNMFLNHSKRSIVGFTMKDEACSPGTAGLRLCMWSKSEGQQIWSWYHIRLRFYDLCFCALVSDTMPLITHHTNLHTHSLLSSYKEFVKNSIVYVYLSPSYLIMNYKCLNMIGQW